LIDRIRHDIQQRLEQVTAEAERLRHALSALDTRSRATPAPATATRRTAAKRPARSSGQSSARTAARAARAADSTATRTAPGQTRQTVLDALSSDHALTAGAVAKATGLGRPTVSTTLSRLAKAGEIVKADRGYRLP
jgi:CRP-like cAMP-binding protein